MEHFFSVLILILPQKYRKFVAKDFVLWFARCLDNCNYGLSTQIPPSLCVAIEQKRKIRLPEYPLITLSYQSKEHLTLGSEKVNISGHYVNIFNVERSVCDALKYRNKIGMDVCAEIINNYLRRKSRNLNLLDEYAKRLRVGNVLRNYLQLALCPRD